MQARNAPLLVACLCAAWCGTCRDYRATFDAAARQVGEASARFTWVDIEDEAEVLGEDLDIESFPTLLIVRDDTVLFFGTVLPHAATVAQLVERALRGDLRTAPVPAVSALARRVRAAAGPA